ncbi:MAG: DNA-processing protein DprA [bacterium]
MNKIYTASICSLPRTGGKLFSMIEERCSEMQISIPEFYNMSENELNKYFTFLNTKFISYFINNRYKIYHKVSSEINFIENIYGGSCILRNDIAYPKKLKSNLNKYSPPILYAIGNLNLLKNNAAGIIGSRNPSQIGLKTAYNIAYQNVLDDNIIISGYAKGIDYQAHLSALSNSGKSIFILPYPLIRFNDRIFKDESLKNEISIEGNFLLISEYLTSYALSMKSMPIVRNRIIAALSDIIYVIEDKLNSGTLNTALKAEELGIPLQVVDYNEIMDNPSGNDYLIKKGVKKISLLEKHI